MSDVFDLLVIGAGMAGTSAAAEDLLRVASAKSARAAVGQSIDDADPPPLCLALVRSRHGNSDPPPCEQPRSVSSFSLRSVSGQVVPMTRVLRAASTTSLVMTSSSLIFRTRWI